MVQELRKLPTVRRGGAMRLSPGSVCRSTERPTTMGVVMGSWRSIKLSCFRYLISFCRGAQTGRIEAVNNLKNIMGFTDNGFNQKRNYLLMQGASHEIPA